LYDIFYRNKKREIIINYKIISIIDFSIEETTFDSPDIKDIAILCNSNLVSKQTEQGKKNKYSQSFLKPIVITAKKETQIIGVSESWNDSKNKHIKIFANMVVEDEYRQMGIASALFERTLTIIKKDPSIEKIVVHFRDSNKDKLPFYQNLGFTNPIIVGSYKVPPEAKWRMEFAIKSPSTINVTKENSTSNTVSTKTNPQVNRKVETPKSNSKSLLSKLISWIK